MIVARKHAWCELSRERELFLGDKGVLSRNPRPKIHMRRPTFVLNVVL